MEIIFRYAHYICMHIDILIISYYKLTDINYHYDCMKYRNAPAFGKRQIIVRHQMDLQTV